MKNTLCVAVAVLSLVPQTAPSETIVRTPARVTTVGFAKSQSLAVTLGADHQMRVLSLPDGRELRAVTVPDVPVDMFIVSPDGRFALMGDHTGMVRVWATASGRLQFERQLSKYPGVAAFSRDGSTLAVAPQGEAVELIDPNSGITKRSLAAPVGGTASVAFSRDGRWIATADGDTAVRVYECATGRRVSENLDSIMEPLVVDFAADGQSVVAGGGDKVLLFIDSATGRTIRRSRPLPQPPAALEVSPDGASIATVFMKSENMTEPDHIVVTPFASDERSLDWLPPTLPAGGGWTGDGHLIVATATSDALHLWKLK